MKPFHLNPLPEWKDGLHNIETGEEWKWRADLEAAEAMYNQWREVFMLVMALAENLPEGDDVIPDHRTFIYQNAHLIAPKILSAAGDTLYQIKMENAALIRFNCRQMCEQIAMAVQMHQADAAHKKVIDEAIDKFKKLFKEWVATFQPDEFTDDWGLF